MAGQVKLTRRVALKECISLLTWPMLAGVVFLPLKSPEVSTTLLVLGLAVFYLVLIAVTFGSWFLYGKTVAAESMTGGSEGDESRPSSRLFLGALSFSVAQFLVVFYALSVFIRGLAFVSWGSAGVYVAGYIALLLIVWAGRNL